MTYRELLKGLEKFTDEQLDCDVTVELKYPCDNDCYSAELRIAGMDHDCLDENHPIIYVP